MITLDDARTAREFWHMTLLNADGTPLRARRSGKTQTWKRDPGKFRIPVKHGIRDCFYIYNFNGGLASNEHLWCTAAKWPAEHVLFEGIEDTTVSAQVQHDRAKLAQARRAFKQHATPAMAAVIELLEKTV